MKCRLICSSLTAVMIVFTGRTGKYLLKVNTAAKADIWKQFPIVWTSVDGEDVEVKYYCACAKCFKVYQYKDSAGKPFGTKNFSEHVKRCTVPANQLQLQQCVRQKAPFSKCELAIVKQRQVEYCIDGYHAFKAVENEGLHKLLQTFVDLGAKHGKFCVSDVMVGRKTVSRTVSSTAESLKSKLRDHLAEPIADGTLSLCLDMYTDDYKKQSYLDVHASWVHRDFTRNHSALAVHHFGTASHTGENMSLAVNDILHQYGIPECDTPVTTDRGSNVVAAMKNAVRLDCMCHRLHTVLENAWADTRRDVEDAATYETAISDLCRFIKQSCGLQEQLPKSLKHGGDTRPWVSLFRRAESVECSYEALVNLLSAKNRLELVANVNRAFNRDVMEITSSVKTVFEALEKVDQPTLHVVIPSYYLLMQKLSTTPRDSQAAKAFKQNLRKYMDAKFWPSISALHWMATFLDPTFKQMEFLPTASSEDVRFRRNLMSDLDTWMMQEFQQVESNLTSSGIVPDQPDSIDRFAMF